MTRFILAACLCLAGVAAFTATRPADIPFQKHALDLGANESCAIADINGDGRPDIVSGENWYEAPRWTQHKFRSLPYTNNYIDNFSDLPLDVNGDGRIDIVSCSWFAKRLFWSENPGPRAAAEWKEHSIETGSPRARRLAKSSRSSNCPTVVVRTSASSSSIFMSSHSLLRRSSRRAGSGSRTRNACSW